jgi:DHA1 family bicyclomycin/chloramphenicol resistance-like MFS transporter
MGGVVLAGLALALAVLVVVVRPWELPEPLDDEPVALAH